MPYRLFLIILTVIMLFVLVIAAASEERGNVASGKAYASEACAFCHAIRIGQSQSPVEKATPFEVVANTPGMTATALAVFFQTPHPTMPNVIITRADRDNLIAYILSLKRE